MNKHEARPSLRRHTEKALKMELCDLRIFGIRTNASVYLFIFEVQEFWVDA